MCPDKACSDLTFLFNYFPFHNCHTPYFKRKATSHTSRILLWGTVRNVKRKKKKKPKIQYPKKPQTRPPPCPPKKTPSKTKQNKELSKDSNDREKQGALVKNSVPL